jgi:hypothetical protein
VRPWAGKAAIEGVAAEFIPCWNITVQSAYCAAGVFGGRGHRGEGNVNERAGSGISQQVGSVQVTIASFVVILGCYSVKN